MNTPAPGSDGTYDEGLRAERRYRSLLEFLPYPVCVFGLDSTVTYVNPAFTKVLKWTLDELEGKRIPFVPDHLLEETHQGLKRLFQCSFKAIEGRYKSTKRTSTFVPSILNRATEPEASYRGNVALPGFNNSTPFLFCTRARCVWPLITA